MCNAANHSRFCPCGFGGDTGGGGRRGRGDSGFVATIEPVSPQWAAGRVESYVTPTSCPECGAAVWFYRSPYDGRVFFDRLGWPWPKHGCTDHSREPRGATRGHASGHSPRAEPAWRDEGWEPLLSVDTYTRHERLRIAGSFRGQFLQFYLPGSQLFDRGSPVFLRELSGKPDLFEITFLRSEGPDVEGHRAVAFRARLAHAGDDMLLKAADDDLIASKKLGQYILWELDDPTGARPYLERAVAGGAVEAAFDLAIAVMFATPKPARQWPFT
jgi:hypothetical protein